MRTRLASRRARRRDGRARAAARRLTGSHAPRFVVSPWHAAIAASLMALVIAATALARTSAGMLALLALTAAAGAALGHMIVRPRAKALIARARGPWPRARGTFAVAAVIATGVAVFWVAVDPSRGGALAGDWGPHHFNVAMLVDALREGRWPTWTTVASSGEAPFETYPFVAYVVAALVTIVLDARDHIPLVFAYLGVACQIGIAVGVTRLALRFAPWPLAVLVGLATLVDRGDDGGGAGGARAMLYWGVFHQGLSQIALLAAFAATLDTLRAPALARSTSVWLMVALAAALHPLALVVVAASVPALGLVALIARDTRPHRAAIAAGDLLIGCALAAVVWAPLAARTLLYGLHYANPAIPISQGLDEALRGAYPTASMPLVVVAAYAGILAAFVSRRAQPALVATLGTLLLLASVDLPFLWSGATPSSWFARFPAFRIPGLAKPFLFALAALSVATLIDAARARRERVGSRPAASWPALAGALAGIVLVVGGRAAVPVLKDTARAAAAQSPHEIPDQQGFDQLVAWARKRAKEQRADRVERLLFLRADFYFYQLAARTGLASLYVGATPGMQLRERIDSTSAESLRRFDVRWVADRDRSPSLGAASTELRFGTYRVRELASWDGALARIESGSGDVIVTHASGDRIELDLRGTSQPALVALGTAYYPRWRARHNGRSVGVHARRAARDGQAHVLALWAPPGRTILTCDGPLASDTRGRAATWLALVACLAIIASYSWRPARRRVARAWAKVLRAVRARRRTFGAALALATSLSLLAAAGAQSLSTDDAVTLAVGAVPDAIVDARGAGETWQPCSYSPWRGAFHCGGRGFVTGAVAALVNDHPAAWPFAAPSIKVFPREDPVDFRVRATRRLAGEHAMVFAGAGASATLRIDGRDVGLSFATRRIDLGRVPHSARIELEVRTHGENVAGLSFVRTSAIGARLDDRVHR